MSVDPAYRSRRCLVAFGAVTAAGLAADLLSKHFVFAALGGQANPSLEIIPGLLRFRLSTNPGIVFGLPVPGWMVLIASVAAVAAVVYIFATSPRRSGWLHAGLALVLGGSLGNTYDRLFARVRLPHQAMERVGEVRDFIDVYPIRYPIFNVADILLVVGVGLILLHMLLGRRSV